MELTVNGEQVRMSGTPDVYALLAHLDLPEDGVAVAVEGVVRPKTQWGQPVPEYSRIDVLTAVQGG